MSLYKLQATQLDFLENSFDQIKPYRLGFTSDFYTALFTDYPQLKPLFAKSNILVQHEKLMEALTLVIQNLCTPDTLSASLKGLGATHVKYGVLPEYYPMFGKSLLKTLADYLGSKWTTEIEEAWTDAYCAIIEVMLEGAEYPQEILQVSSAGNDSTPTTPTNTASQSSLEELPYQRYGRPLAEILADLSKPIPDGLVKTPQNGSFQVTFIAGNVLARLLDHLAPGWEGFVISSQVIGNCSVVSYRITIHAAEGAFSREAVGSAVLRTTGNGDPFADAEANAFIHAAAKWGLIIDGVAGKN